MGDQDMVLETGLDVISAAKGLPCKGKVKDQFKKKVQAAYRSIDIRVGHSSKNTKTVYLKHRNMKVSPKPVNKQYSDWNDTFSVRVVGNKLYVTRIDWNGGWGQDLVLRGYY